MHLTVRVPAATHGYTRGAAGTQQRADLEAQCEMPFPQHSMPAEPFATVQASTIMMKPKEDIQNLAIRARDGDGVALADLVELLRMKLFAVAYRETGNYHDAQDVAASSILQICLHISELREPSTVQSWMYAITRNESARVYRGRKHENDALDTDCIPHVSDGAKSALRMDIERALRLVPRDLARAVALHYLAGLSVRNIADRLGRPEGTIKRWLHEGRLELATQMEEYAPMETKRTATIVHTELDEGLLGSVIASLKAAGFSTVNVLTDLDSVSGLVEEGEGEHREFHVPKCLTGSRLVVLDEWIGGRSAFELYSTLKASAEAPDMGFCLLLSKPAQSTLFAAWAAGFDLCFSKELMGNSFLDCVSKWVEMGVSGR